MKNLFDNYYSQAKSAFASERYENALLYCEQAIKISPGRFEPFSLAGNACLVLHDNLKAEKYFKQAIIIDHNTGERYFDLANSLFGQQRLSEALENFAIAIQLGCRDDIMQKIYYLMGVINQVDKKNYKDALLNYEKSERIPGANVDQTEILLKRIQIYVEQGRFENAENCAVQLKLLVPSEFQSYQLLFQLYLEQKKTVEANNILLEAEENIEHDSGIEVEIGFDRAMLYCFMAQQYPDDAVQYYEKALEQLKRLDESRLLSIKDKCEVLITSAEIHMKLKQYDRAIQLAQKGEEHTEPEVKEYLERARYLLLECADAKQDYKSVRKYARKLKESDNIFYKHHGYYSEAYAVKKMAEINHLFQKEYIDLYNMAIAYYRNCTVTSPGDFLAYLYRAKSYVDIGKYNKAIEIGKLLPEDAQKSLYDYIDNVRKGE